jgi:hypothetical protein
VVPQHEEKHGPVEDPEDAEAKVGGACTGKAAAAGLASQGAQPLRTCPAPCTQPHPAPTHQHPCTHAQKKRAAAAKRGKGSAAEGAPPLQPIPPAPLSEEEKTDVAALAMEHMQADSAQVGGGGGWRGSGD